MVCTFASYKQDKLLKVTWTLLRAFNLKKRD
jgi:hypothetical protein